MKNISDLLGGARDPQGRLILGDPHKGCQYCGHVTTHTDDRVVAYHPGTECCIPALQNLIRWRKNERAELKHKMEIEEEQIITTGEARIETADTKYREGKAEAKLALQRDRFDEKVRSTYAPHMDELDQEIQEYQTKLEHLQAHAGV